MIKKHLLPWLIGILCVAQIGVGTVAAAGIRSDQRKAAAIAKEKRDVAAFRAAITPIALAAFDAVQPIQDLVDDPDLDQPYYPRVRNDVLERSGAVAALTSLQTRLAAVKAPRSKVASMKALTKGMTDMLAATKLLSQATHAKGDRSGYVKAFGPAFDALVSGSSFWSIALSDEFGAGKVAAPSSGWAAAAGRRTATKGGYITAVDRACGVAFVAFDALPERPDPVVFVRDVMPRHAVINDRLAKSLRSMGVPSEPAARRIRTMAGAVAGFASRERAVVTAQRTGDPAVYAAAYRALIGSLPAVRDLSHAYGEYGATLCADLLDVSELLAPSGSADKPDLTT